MNKLILGFLLVFAAGARAAAAETSADGCYTRQDLTARAAGFVDHVAVTDGAVVKAGTVIAELDSRLAQAQVHEAKAGVSAASANVDLARDSRARLGKLAASNTVAPQELFDAGIKVRQAEAQLAQAKAALEKAEIALSDTRIKAVIDGRVSGLPQVKGLFVQAGHPLGRIEATTSHCNAGH